MLDPNFKRDQKQLDLKGFKSTILPPHACFEMFDNLQVLILKGTTNLTTTHNSFPPRQPHKQVRSQGAHKSVSSAIENRPFKQQDRALGRHRGPGDLKEP